MSGHRLVRYGLAGEVVEVLDSRTLADAIEGNIARLRAQYDAEIARGMVHAGRPLQIDEASQARMTAVVAQIGAGIPLPAGFAWRMADNTPLVVTGPAMTALAGAAAARVQALRRALWVAVDAVRAAPTVAAADAVAPVWPA